MALNVFTFVLKHQITCTCYFETLHSLAISNIKDLLHHDNISNIGKLVVARCHYKQNIFSFNH